MYLPRKNKRVVAEDRKLRPPSAGEGIRAAVLEDGWKRFSPSLEPPEGPGSPQVAPTILPESSHPLPVANAEAGQPRAAGLRQTGKTGNPDRLQRELRGRRLQRETLRLLDDEA